MPSQASLSMARASGGISSSLSRPTTSMPRASRTPRLKAVFLCWLCCHT
ncbi:Uncharacterised protein [Bordetella pertussis]|nr:Uncharacterised protein [Bordetella pertussis]CFP66015.1 Uncharacterised protein [Bordetella pertussis]